MLHQQEAQIFVRTVGDSETLHCAPCCAPLQRTCKCRMLKEVHLGGSVQELRAENVHIKHELWAFHQRLSSSDAEVGQLVAKAHGMESEVCSLTRYKSTARTGVTFS
jgi:hypothetical protein